MRVALVAKDSHPTVQLQNAQYHNGNDRASAEYADVRLLTDQIAFGDLNGDGKGDAAVMMAENYGGTGVFVSLVAVLNRGGQPEDAGAVTIDDRPAVDRLSIQDYQILLDGRVHGPSDPACCAAEPVTQAYGLTEAGIALFRQSSKAPDGTERAIHIDSPALGEQVPAGPMQIKGTYTVAPFEGTLAYHVHDSANNTLAAGPLLTTPATGSTGVTFDETIDLTGLQSGLPIRVDVADMSAADGSTIAIDSVELVIK